MAAIKSNTLLLTSGRQIKLRGGTLSISPTLEIGDAYTTGVFNFNSESKYHPELNKISNPYNLTAEEIHEIGDYMITQWQALKENVRNLGINNVQIFQIPEH